MTELVINLITLRDSIQGDAEYVVLERVEGTETPNLLYFPAYGETILDIFQDEGWFGQKDLLASELEGLANSIIQSFPVGHDEHHYGLLNYNALYRKANILRKFTGQPVTIRGIDFEYWHDSNIPPDILEQDNQNIRNGVFDDFDNLDENHVQENQGGDDIFGGDFDVEGGNFDIEGDDGDDGTFSIGGREIPLKIGYITLAIIAFSLTMGVMFLISSQTTLLDNIGGSQQPPALGDYPVGDSSSSEYVVDENGQQVLIPVAPDTFVPTAIPSGNNGQSMSMQGLQNKLMQIISLFSQVVFWLMVFLGIAFWYKVFMDSRARTSPGDSAAFLQAILIALAVAVLPFKSILIITVDIGEWYSFGMPTSYNLLLLFGIGMLLFGISKDRNTGLLDLTPLSTGLFVMGMIFFVTNINAFLSWELPLESWVAWVLAIIIHFFELIRQKNTGVSLTLTALGVAMQLGIFFGLSWALSLTGVPLIIQFSLPFSFVVSVMVVIGIVGVALNAVSDQDLLPAGAGFAVHVETASHDASIYILMWSTIFLVKFWG